MSAFHRRAQGAQPQASDDGFCANQLQRMATTCTGERSPDHMTVNSKSIGHGRLDQHSLSVPLSQDRRILWGCNLPPQSHRAPDDRR
jgi:hypothetical protein